ncbi:hypothetical protein PLICRDRAFT_110345 [Plicaturopsis crispa FD-325 SS-3]|nr:hypothetical protein PLICRDRAFT_110345 [Plicaturopsis crispa FD-325 SS-3]
MGAGQSKSESEEQVFQNETPIQFSQDFVNTLADHSAAPGTSPERQSTLDSHIRSRINAELERLRGEEEQVRQEVERALEKENLDREKSMAGETAEKADEELHGEVKSSASLLGDLEEIRSKVDKYQKKQELSDHPDVKASGEAVVSCYRNHPTTPLDCWREVNAFKTSVADLEKVRFKVVQLE